ncbi:phosphoenolpyruvate carboxylase [Candidatus Parvarchaeota archaeon]|nr:phosphoenolpyruvate carboxylase [Candidatus Parvarchaeota archaeon]
MSTQHPDNVQTPFFSDSEIILGETEIKEAYYVFSHLAAREQMWDSEGKEVDNFVVEKLFSKYNRYFREHRLGEDIFITTRVPNPTVEKDKGKLLLETLEGIPRNFDTAMAFGQDCAPIFEIILPMTSSYLEIERIHRYYEKYVVGKAHKTLVDSDITISQWIGEIKPDKISVIPLFENSQSILASAQIAEKYISNKKDLEYQRIFLARSDPALNYGSVSAVLLAKVALQRLNLLEEKSSVKILPILGVGSAPFRGNMKPINGHNCTGEYPSVQTFTLQSSFKYDYPERVVRDCIDSLNETSRGRPLAIDEQKALALVEKITSAYQREVEVLAPHINKISKFIPAKRARKLHIGLFGYNRAMKGIKLPRAINFCASLYSLGIPPETLGLSALSEKEFDCLREIYVHLEEDLRDAFKFANPDNIRLLPSAVSKNIKKALSFVPVECDGEYIKTTSFIWKDMQTDNSAIIPEHVQHAAYMRGFLG